MSDEELIIVLKNRINTLIEHHNKLLEELFILNKQHPEYISNINFIKILDKLGALPNTVNTLKKYIDDASKIYLNTMNNVEKYKDNFV